MAPSRHGWSSTPRSPWSSSGEWLWLRQGRFSQASKRYAMMGTPPPSKSESDNSSASSCEPHWAVTGSLGCRTSETHSQSSHDPLLGQQANSDVAPSKHARLNIPTWASDHLAQATTGANLDAIHLESSTMTANKNRTPYLGTRLGHRVDCPTHHVAN